MQIAIVGATGLVGSSFLQLMEEERFFPEKLRLFAGKKSLGKTLRFHSQDWPVELLSKGCFQNTDIAFFSAGGEVSRQWARQAVEEGALVIDNSSAFRMEKEIPLIVPEVNGSTLNASHRLIANPNCSTIQMALVLHPLQKAFGLDSVQVSTYQSASGAGASKMNLLKEQTAMALKNNVLHNETAFNCTPAIGEIDENGYCVEEIKMQEETKKILNLPQLSISAFTVRVPTLVSHGEALWVRLKNSPHRKELIQTLKAQEGLAVMESVKEFPTNQTSSGKNKVYAGRIHQNPQDPKQWLIWVTADNVRKGAALNGLQMALFLLDNIIKSS